MNCVCGCSVFDHAKRQMFMVSEYDGGIKIPHHGPSFTLSGTCLRCVTLAMSGAGGLVCSGFRRPAKYASALRHLAEAPMRLLVLFDEEHQRMVDLLDEAQPVRRKPRIQSTADRLEPTLSVVRDIYAMPPQPTPEAWAEWWKKYDRPPEPGRTETM